MASSFKTRPTGLFIVLEGIDGSGTTTQAKLLVEAFSKRNIESWFTFEPTQFAIGGQIRKMLRKEITFRTWRAEALMFAADRADHLPLIEEKLNAGTHVVCDRYDLSNYTYQRLSRPDDDTYLADERAEILRELNEPHRRPDLTIVLDIPANVAELRRGARDEQPEIYDVPQLQRRLAGLYARAEQLLPAGDYVVHLDATRTQEEIHGQIWNAYEQLVRMLSISESAL